MPEAQRRFSMSQLEAFSDGVIAVIITIMVLELKAPETPEPAALLRVWPSFAIYLVSFVLVAIYWINHHNFSSARGCDRSPHLGQQRASVLPVADPVRDRLRCRHAARSLPDDGLRGAAVRLRAGLLTRPFDNMGRAAGGTRAV